MSRKAHLSLHLAFAFFLAVSALTAHAQDAPPRRGGGNGEFAGMNRAGGEITAVAPDRITIKTEDSAVMQIVTPDNTRLMKGRGETVKFADLKIGDGVTAIGNLDAPTNTLHAAMLMVVDAAQVKALKDNLGKTYIAGKVTAIDLDNATMTVMRADKVSQTITFDETTSFRRGRAGMGGGGMGGFGGGGMGGDGAGGGGRRPGGDGGTPPPNAGESITLADIKVGDSVIGQGSLKNSVFVPTQLTVATPGAGQGQGRRRGGGVDGTPPPPATTVPPQR